MERPSLVSTTPPPTAEKARLVPLQPSPRQYGDSRINFGVKEDAFQRQSIRQENRSLYPRIPGEAAAATMPLSARGSTPRRFGMHRGACETGFASPRPWGAGTILGTGANGVQFPVTGAHSALRILGEHAVHARVAAEVHGDGRGRFPFEVSSYRAYH
mmetsp:Transcript_36830/g.86365  ORF Transcript_36830/g.86365 Transcript_36830/m.86365 type:complete len:158 (-) Transcript_36830:59-532(-)